MLLISLEVLSVLLMLRKDLYAAFQFYISRKNYNVLFFLLNIIRAGIIRLLQEVTQSHNATIGAEIRKPKNVSSGGSSPFSVSPLRPLFFTTDLSAFRRLAVSLSV